MKATERLSEEHRAIKVMLEIAGKVSERLENHEEVKVEHLEQIIEFIKGFADQYHHAKEEDLLFPELEKAGVPKEGGPVGVMLMEHDQGRAYVAGMSEAVAKYKTGDKEAAPQMVENIRGYIALLNEHIDKEDHCLFAMADAQLSEEQQKQLTEGFAKVEEERGGAATQEKFQRILSQLKGIYLT